MPSDYQKQLEEENWVLRNRLEKFESRCEWLEKLHLLHISGRWSIQTSYEVGINTYKSSIIQTESMYLPPKDSTLSEIMKFIHEDVIQPYATWKANIDKVTLEYEYNNWKSSIMVFLGLVKSIYDTDKYKDINKISITTCSFVQLGRFTTDFDPDSFNFYDNGKDFSQGITITVRRGERLPICSVRIKKKINGFECNNEFMSFRNFMKSMSGIYEAMENLAKCVADLEESRRREWDANH